MERCDRFACRAAVIGCLALVTGCVSVNPPSPPGQPVSGPGSAAVAAKQVRTTTIGEGGRKVHIYEPEGAGLTSAPVIVFLHGYSGINPQVYGGWIRHLVERGNIVLYPVYQETLREPELYTGNALAAVQTAYAALQDGNHIAPDPVRLAIVGHSLGGTIAMNLAAIAHTSGLPAVQAVMAANAGDTTSQTTTVPSIQTGNYNQIPAEMLFLGVVGEQDEIVGDDIVLVLYDAIPQVPSANREVLRLFTDTYGEPDLDATHRAPLAVDEAFDSGESLLRPLAGRLLLAGGRRSQEPPVTNAVDYYGYWKWLDALTDAAFYGTNRQYALGNTAEQTFMGLWSDGEPVRPAERIRPEP